MDVFRRCAERIVDHHLTKKMDVLVLCDRSHAKLANMIRKNVHSKNRNVEYLVVESKVASDHAFLHCLAEDLETLVLMEPRSFSVFQVYNWLDFKFGTPKVAGLHSHSFVSIFPIASTLRVFGADISRDIEARNRLLSLVEPNSHYTIVTSNGTELFFTSRHWLDQGNEVLTAPIEQSINGVIAVDGALFFQKIDTVIDFHIKAGELVKIQARDKQYENLVEQYKQMTKYDFVHRKNRQLAEIGLGCNTGAIISNCFMESEMVYGTSHFCFGNNACYGGDNESEFHGGSVLIQKPHFLLK